MSTKSGSWVTTTRFNPMPADVDEAMYSLRSHCTDPDSGRVMAQVLLTLSAVQGVYRENGDPNSALRMLELAKKNLPFEDAREDAGKLAYLLERDHDKALKRGRAR